MEQPLYPAPSKDLTQKRKDLAPEIFAAFQGFSQQVFADGALPSKTKELIAVAVAHVTQCPYCIRSHTNRATLKGATGRYACYTSRDDQSIVLYPGSFHNYLRLNYQSCSRTCG